MRNFETNIIIGGRLSPSLQRAFESVQRFTQTSSNAFRQVNTNVQRLSKSLSYTSQEAKLLASSISAAGTAAATALAAKGATEMLNQASSMEQYRNTLNVVMKDTEKAGETFKWAVDYANKTPFETGEIVDATVKLQSYGLEAQKMLPYVGDMAAAMGKGMDQAVEALADAQTGELERLKEFGITKQQIVEQGHKKLGDLEIVNNKGQIVNQRAFNAALVSLMKDRFEGGMEVQAKSFKGIMSTISGVWKSGLARMAGIGEDGLIIDGSALDILKDKALLLSEKLQKMQESGKFDELQKSLSKFVSDASKKFDEMIPKIKEFGKFVLNNGPLIGNTIKFIGTSFVAWHSARAIATVTTGILGFINVLNLARTKYIPYLIIKAKDMALTGAIRALYLKDAIVKGLSIAKTLLLAGAQGALNLVVGIGTGVMGAFGAVMAFLTSPIGLVIAAITALIGVGYLLCSNWDSISKFFVGVWQNYVLPFFSCLTGWFSGLWESITGTFKGFINGIISGINGLIGMLNKVSFTIPEWVPIVGGKHFGINIPQIPQFAKGGIATQTSICGEAGPEAVIPLKKNNPRSIQLLEQTSRLLGVNQKVYSNKVIERGNQVNILNQSSQFLQREPLKPLTVEKRSSINNNNNNFSSVKSGGNNYYFSPNITIGNNSNPQDINEQIKNLFEEFKNFIENMKENEKRESIDDSVFNI